MQKKTVFYKIGYFFAKKMAKWRQKGRQNGAKGRPRGLKMGSGDIGLSNLGVGFPAEDIKSSTKGPWSLETGLKGLEDWSPGSNTPWGRRTIK